MEPIESKDLLEKPPTTKIKVYKRRWLILAIYIFYCAANSFQWLEYSIISNVVMRFYDIDAVDVDWTTIMFMVMYPVVVIPVSYIIDKKGLRVAALYGGLGTALAAAVKIFSLSNDRFFVVLIGQASIACALGVFGCLSGFALGSIVPPTLVKNHDDVLLIGSNMSVLCWGLTIYMIPVSLAILFFFPPHPPLPPSAGQEQARTAKPPTFRKFLVSFKEILTQNGFICHMLAYGINVGSYVGVGTLLNQFVLQYLPNSEEDVGWMQFLSVVFGIGGCLINGLFLDKTKKFKEATLFNYFMTALSLAIFLGMLVLKNKVLMYLTYVMFGFFTNTYLSVGYEMAVEMTYPLDESTGSSALNASYQSFGVVLILLLGELNKHFGACWSILSQVILLLIGTYLTYLIPNKNKRYEAFLKCNAEENMKVNQSV